MNQLLRASRQRQLAEVMALAIIAIGMAACASPSAPEVTVGPETLQLNLTASATAVRPTDRLVVWMYASNPSRHPVVARVDCLHYGLGLVLRSSGGVVADVFTGIPPCKILGLAPTLRVAPGMTDSSATGWIGFMAGHAPGHFDLQVVYRTVEGVFSGPSRPIELLAR